MDSPRFRTIFVALLALLVWVPAASAATPAQIHDDAADGSIDGRYSLADLRAANRAVSTEQREYYGWEDVYREHVRQIAAPRKADGATPDVSPGAPTVTGSSTSGGGTAGTPREPVATATDPGDSSAATARSDERVVEASAVETTGTNSTAAASDDAESRPWLLLSVPVLILAAGSIGWAREVRRRRRRDAAHGR